MAVPLLGAPLPTSVSELPFVFPKLHKNDLLCEVLLESLSKIRVNIFTQHFVHNPNLTLILVYYSFVTSVATNL